MPAPENNVTGKKVMINAVIIGSGALLAGVLIFWLKGDIVKRVQSIVDVSSEAAGNSRDLASFLALEQDAATAEIYQTRMAGILPGRDQVLEFPRWIEGMARVHTVSIEFTFQGQEIDPQENFPGYVPFEAVLSGGYDAILDFLRDTEGGAGRFLVEFTGFDLQGDGAVYRMTTNGRVFFR